LTAAISAAAVGDAIHHVVSVGWATLYGKHVAGLFGSGSTNRQYNHPAERANFRGAEFRTKRELVLRTLTILNDSTQAARQCQAQLAQLGRLAQHMIDMRRDIPIGNQSLSPTGQQ
jgi:hypothetical protein